jgi:hypothetical protein
MEHSPSSEANSSSLRSASQEIPRLYGIRFIAVFIRACHWSLSWARWIQSTSSNHIYLRSILILSFHLRTDLPSCSFPSGLPTKILYALLIPMRATCPAHLILLNFIVLTIFVEGYKLITKTLDIYADTLQDGVQNTCCSLWLQHVVVSLRTLEMASRSPTDWHTRVTIVQFLSIIRVTYSPGKCRGSIL